MTAKCRIRRLRAWQVVLAFCAGVWAIFEAVSAVHMLRNVPQKFGIAWPYYEGGCGGFLSYHGAFAVGLDRGTLASIRAERERWFNNVGPPRGADSRMFFEDWKPMPLPDSTWSDGIPYDLYCAKTHSWLWPHAIVDELKKPGGYYAKSGNRSAYVLPSLSLIIITPNTR